MPAEIRDYNVLLQKGGCYAPFTKWHFHDRAFSFITDGCECHVGNHPVKVLATPGDTQNSYTLVFHDRMLTGDAGVHSAVKILVQVGFAHVHAMMERC